MNLAAIDAGGTTIRMRLVAAKSRRTVWERTAPAARDLGPDPVVGAYRALGLECASVCAGIAGVSRPTLAARWQDGLESLPGRPKVAVVPDWHIALEGAFPDRDGILLLAGTGSVAVGKLGSHCERIGGRGWEYGDEGSGTHATSEVIRRTLRALDGLAPHTPLTRRVATELGATTTEGFFTACSDRIAAEGRGFLVPFLVLCAGSGEVESARLLAGMAGWLARLVTGAADKCRFPYPSAPPVAYAGGMRAADQWILPALETILQRRWPHVRTMEPAGSPLDGAVAMARGNLPDIHSEG